MREIRRRYTKSDLVLLGWDSQQKSYNMSKGFKRQPKLLSDGTKPQKLGSLNAQIVETEDAYLMPDDLNNGVPIPKKFFTKDGEFDLRLATGPEAKHYMEALGVHLPPVLKM